MEDSVSVIDESLIADSNDTFLLRMLSWQVNSVVRENVE